MYDAQGRPAMWLPSSSLAVVNVSYSSTGQLVGLQRGSMSERTEFDPQGRIVSRSFVDGKVWSYSYLDKVRTLWGGDGPCNLMLHVFKKGEWCVVAHDEISSISAAKEKF